MLDLEKLSFHVIWYSGPFNLTFFRKLCFYAGNHISSVSICFFLLGKDCLVTIKQFCYFFINYKGEKEGGKKGFHCQEKPELSSDFVRVEECE